MVVGSVVEFKDKSPNPKNGLSHENKYMYLGPAKMKHPDTRASFNGLGKPGDAPLWPDHILCRNASVESYEVLDSKKYGPKYISDHYPVYAEFEIPIPKGK